MKAIWNFLQMAGLGLLFLWVITKVVPIENTQQAVPAPVAEIYSAPTYDEEAREPTKPAMRSRRIVMDSVVAREVSIDPLTENIQKGTDELMKGVNALNEALGADEVTSSPAEPAPENTFQITPSFSNATIPRDQWDFDANANNGFNVYGAGNEEIGQAYMGNSGKEFYVIIWNIAHRAGVTNYYKKVGAQVTDMESTKRGLLHIKIN